MSGAPTKQSLREMVTHLAEDGDACLYPLNDSFWQDLAARTLFAGGWLVSQHEFSGRWDHWEMHPRGEEFVYLLSGAVDFEFGIEGDSQIVQLRSAGDYVIVPRGVWHIGQARAQSSVLSITCGDGTEHRPD